MSLQTLYYNGDIITMTAENRYAEAIVVDSGKIKFVGTKSKAEALCTPMAVFVDLQGKTLMPSFIDPHSHILDAAAAMNYADLSECKSFADIVEILRAYAKREHITEQGVIVGVGYDHNALQEQKYPDKTILDKVSDTIPVFIRHASIHMGVANSVLLKLAGIDEYTADPTGAKFGRMPGSNEPDGYVEEMNALAKFNDVFSERIRRDWPTLFRKAEKRYIENGITTAQDGATSTEGWDVLLQLAEHQLINMDIVSYFRPEADPEEKMKAYPEYMGRYKKHLKIGGWKMFLDGAPQSKTAWLSSPYEGERTYCGYPAMTDEELTGYLQQAVNNRHQALAHCNGDAASEQFLRCYTKALDESDLPDKMGLRPVMIHCQTVKNDQLDRMAALKMIPSFFVAHTYYWGDVHLKNLGFVRGSHISPAKAALDRNLIINFHRDTPVVAPLMLHSVWCAVNRITKNGISIGEDQCISVYDALKAITCNAAYEYFEEKTKGSLESGKLADLVILDRNPLKVDTMDIKDIIILEVIKEGKTLYKR